MKILALVSTVLLVKQVNATENGFLDIFLVG